MAKKIVDAKGDYVLAVKDNQPKLHEAIKDLFSDERQDEFLKMPHRQHQTSEKGHGRYDDLCYVLAKIPRNASWKDAWPGATAVGMAVRMTAKRDGTTDGDVRYVISSCYLSGERFAQDVRGHWGLENSLHWGLDVTVHEYRLRTRKRYATMNHC